ncbi:ExbD/TolR family protein [Marinimicrobium sp. ARAG 43.8]|uniref:ExbD/TolR family protein n=1 Tax=Marinimicrobium sp. ARAG 43.8 TaxID=3418719 RepID=UPI003CF3436D
MRYRRKHQSLEAAELNITAFMNLMVILIPFLLITAILSRMTVLELNLPGADAEGSSDEVAEGLQLQVVVTRKAIVIRETRLGLIRKLDRNDSEEPWDGLRGTLLEIKSKFPRETSVALLLEPDASYDLMM